MFLCKFNSPQVKGIWISTMMDIILGDFSILYQLFFSQKVGQSMNTSNKHGISDLPHELPNDL